jgi:hypothetical protein
MATIFNLEVIFRAIDQLSVPMAKMQKKINDFSKKANEMGKGLQEFGKGMMEKVTAPIMLLASIGVHEFANQEEAILKLKNAIKLTGREGEISVDSLTKLADELQDVTKFSDDASISAMALVQQMGGLSESQLKELLPVMQDFAQMHNMDLQEAANMFGKSLATGNNLLQRQGILFTESTNKGQFFKNMIEAVSKQSGGTAKAAAGGLSGALSHLKTSFEDITKIIGEQLAPIIIKISQKFIQLKNWFEGLSPKMKHFIVMTLLIIAAIGPAIFIIGKLISILGMLGKAFAILRLLISPQGLIILAIVAAIILLIIVIRNWGKITTWISDKWSKLIDYIQRMPRIIFYLIGIFAPFLLLPLLIIRNWEKIFPFFARLWEGITSIFTTAGDAIGGFFTQLWQGIVNAFVTAVDKIKEIWGMFTKWAMKNPVLKWLFETKPEKQKAKLQDQTTAITKDDDKKKKSSLFNMENMFSQFKTKQGEKQVVYVNVKVSADENSTATIEQVKTNGKVQKKITTDPNYAGNSYIK